MALTRDGNVKAEIELKANAASSLLAHILTDRGVYLKAI